MAWNGDQCDLKHIYKLVQAPNTNLSFPDKLLFFLDPLKIIREYKGCKLHPSKSKLPNLCLGTVWKYIHNQNLDGAHCALVDCIAQTNIIKDKRFLDYIDKSKSVRTIESIFNRRQQLEIKKQLEPVLPVHFPWKELNAHSSSWTPHRDCTYAGAHGGGVFGPTQGVRKTAYDTESILHIFMMLFPEETFSFITSMTHKYVYEDWVKLKIQKDQDGNEKKTKIFVNCDELDEGATHRGESMSTKYEITLGFVISWIGLVIINGALGRVHSIRNYYRDLPYGINYPPFRNSMSRTAFEFMRKSIHFADNDNHKPRGHIQYDPLFKIRILIDHISKNVSKAFLPGEHLTVDESMIKYMGRAVSFVQYNPAKPIKHGIKVFCICCAYTAYMLGFSVYVGKDNLKKGETGSTLEVVDNLIDIANLRGSRGRILFTDNWYTSINLATFLYEQYGWTMVGTLKPSKKQARESNDVPFIKMSGGALSEVDRGWYREAVMEVITNNRRKYFIQCSTWKDKKQVLFLHTHAVGPSVGESVRRNTKGADERIEISAPKVQKEYATYYNAVDRNDRDSADYTTSMRTNRWYLRIVFWLLDRVIHCTYVIVIELLKEKSSRRMNIYPHEWQRYLSKNEGRRHFQIDLGIEIVNYGISLDWKNLEEPRPKWVSTYLQPCGCKRCFFCVNGFTNGIDHKSKKMDTPSPNKKKENKRYNKM